MDTVATFNKHCDNPLEAGPRRIATVSPAQGDSYRTIPLTQGQVAFVDTKDYEWLSRWKWFANDMKGEDNAEMFILPQRV
jgi:hypothetical protein